MKKFTSCSKSWIFFFGALFFAAPFFAQAERSHVSVDRAIIDLRTEVGKDAEFSFMVQNDGESLQKIHLEAKDIIFGQDNAVSFSDALDGFSSKVSFSQNDFVLASRERRAISGNVRISQDGSEEILATMAVVVSFASDGEENEEKGPKIQGKIGVYLLAAPGKFHNASGMIENIQAPKIIGTGDELKISYANTGDVHFVPESKVRVRNLLNRDQLEIRPEARFVFPGKSAIFKANIGSISPWGFFRLEIEFIDGNGERQSDNVYACGALFLPGLFLLAISFFLFGRFIVKNRRKK